MPSDFTPVSVALRYLKYRYSQFHGILVHYRVTTPGWSMVRVKSIAQEKLITETCLTGFISRMIFDFAISTGSVRKEMFK